MLLTIRFGHLSLKCLFSLLIKISLRLFNLLSLNASLFILNALILTTFSQTYCDYYTWVYLIWLAFHSLTEMIKEKLKLKPYYYFPLPVIASYIHLYSDYVLFLLNILVFVALNHLKVTYKWDVACQEKSKDHNFKGHIFVCVLLILLPTLSQLVSDGGRHNVLSHLDTGVLVHLLRGPVALVVPLWAVVVPVVPRGALPVHHLQRLEEPGQRGGGGGGGGRREWFRGWLEEGCITSGNEVTKGKNGDIIRETAIRRRRKINSRVRRLRCSSRGEADAFFLDDDTKKCCSWTHHGLISVLVVIAGAGGQHRSGLLLISDLVAGEKLAELLNAAG